MSEQDLRIVHITDGTTFAGIEAHLLSMFRSARVHSPPIQMSFVFTSDGDVAKKFRKSGADVLTLSPSAAKSVRILRKHFCDLDADIIHMHGYLGVTLGCLASWSLRAQPMVTLHANVEPGHGPLEKVWWYNRLARFLPQLRGARFIAVSNAVASDYSRRGISSNKMTVVHNGIAPPSPENKAGPPADPSRKFQRMRFGIVGRLVWVKDHELFLRAAALVAAEADDAEFVIIGDGPLRERLERLSQQLGINHQVVFTGNTDNVSRELGRLGALVITSRSEGIPYSLLEAMQAGLPVISAKVGGLPEILTDKLTALIPGSRTANDFGKAMMSVYSDPTLRARLSTSAREMTEGPLSGSAMLEETLRAYQSAQSGRP